MKPLNSAAALLIAIGLISGLTGCKHGPVKPPTPIPAYSAPAVTTPEVTVPPVRLVNQTPVNPGNNLQNQRPVTENTVPGGGKIGDGGVNSNNLGNNPGGGQTTATQLNPPVVTDQNRINDIRRPEGPQDEDRDVLAGDTVYFEYDRNTVKPSEVPKVQRAAAYLKNNPNVTVRIEGNCDERGTEEYNRSLGERRALAVRELLISEGVAPERITTLSFGEDKPADPGHDEAAWSKNRRGDFVVLKPITLQ